MKIREYLNITQEEIESRKHNIFIPICLKNKYFSINNILTPNVEKYLNWALENTKEKVLFIIPDKIQDTNYIVRNSSNSEEQNLRRALKDGKRIKEKLEELVLSHPKKEQNKINIINWEEYEKEDYFCMKTTHLVYKEFKNNKEFQDKVLETSKTTVTDREFSEKKRWRLCDYILDEFSLCYAGIKKNKSSYKLLLYPESDPTVHFLTEIQQGKIFPKLNKKLPQEKVSYAILR